MIDFKKINITFLGSLVPDVVSNKEILYGIRDIDTKIKCLEVCDMYVFPCGIIQFLDKTSGIEYVYLGDKELLKGKDLKIETVELYKNGDWLYETCDGDIHLYRGGKDLTELIPEGRTIR